MELAPVRGPGAAQRGRLSAILGRDDLRANWFGFMVDDVAGLQAGDVVHTCVTCGSRYPRSHMVRTSSIEVANVNFTVEGRGIVSTLTEVGWDSGYREMGATHFEELQSRTGVRARETVMVVEVPSPEAEGPLEVEAGASAEVEEEETQRQSALLRLALDDLDDVSEAAHEENLPEPSPVAFEQARRILGEMYEEWPRRFMVYPMHGGYIAIDALGRVGDAVMVMCGSNGDARCIVTIDGEDRRAAYSSANIVPDAFVRQALSDLWSLPSA